MGGSRVFFSRVHGNNSTCGMQELFEHFDNRLSQVQTDETTANNVVSQGGLKRLRPFAPSFSFCNKRV